MQFSGLSFVMAAFGQRATPSVKACGFATFPKGTAFAAAGNFAAAPKGVPLGELPNEVRLRGYSQACALSVKA